jgi:adenylate kinase
MKMIVAAVPAAGKSTVLQLVKKRLPEVKIVIFGDLMFEIAKKKFNLKDRDEMREKISVDDYKIIQEETSQEIANMPEKSIIVDTHLSIKMSHGFYPGIPEHIARIIKPDLVAVLEYNPKDVVERRKKDAVIKDNKITEIGTTRIPRSKRDIETEEQIQKHQEFNRILAFVIGNFAGCPVKIIDLTYKEKKPFEHAFKAAEEIINELKA